MFTTNIRKTSQHPQSCDVEMGHLSIFGRSMNVHKKNILNRDFKHEMSKFVLKKTLNETNRGRITKENNHIT